MVQDNKRIKSQIDTMLNADFLTIANKSKLRKLGLDYMEDNWKKRVVLCTNLTSQISNKDHADIAGTKNGLRFYIPKCEAVIDRLKESREKLVLEENLDEVIGILSAGVKEYKELYAQIEVALIGSKEKNLPISQNKPKPSIDVHAQITACMSKIEEKYFDLIKKNLQENLQKMIRIFNDTGVKFISLGAVRRFTKMSAFSQKEMSSLFLNAKKGDSGFEPHKGAEELIERTTSERAGKYVQALIRKLTSNFTELENKFGSIKEFQIKTVPTEKDNECMKWSAKFTSNVEMSGSLHQYRGHRSSGSDRLDPQKITSPDGFDNLSTFDFRVDRLTYTHPETKQLTVMRELHTTDLDRVCEVLKGPKSSRSFRKRQFATLSS